MDKAVVTQFRYWAGRMLTRTNSGLADLPDDLWLVLLKMSDPELSQFGIFRPVGTKEGKQDRCLVCCMAATLLENKEWE